MIWKKKTKTLGINLSSNENLYIKIMLITIEKIDLFVQGVGIKIKN